MDMIEFDRRNILIGLAAVPIMSSCKPPMEGSVASEPIGIWTESPALTTLEEKNGGRLGVYILDTASGKAIGHRAEELFGMCSTFKLSLAAAILQAADQGRLKLDTILPFGEADMLSYAPVTRANLDKGGMTIGALAKATQITSDNVAANLLTAQLGGPEGLTKFFRSIGDDVTRVDRLEPLINLVPDGEVRDTTSPIAMAVTMQKILTGDVLKPASRDMLIDWMVSTTTGGQRIRAGLPPRWRAGDKTGTAASKEMHNKTNDVAIFWPPARSPVIVTAYYESDAYYKNIRDSDQAVLAEVGRIAAAQAVEWLGGLD